MAQTSNKGFVNTLRNIFGIGVTRNKQLDKDQFAIANKDYERGSKQPKVFNNLPDEIQKLYKLWLDDTYENSNTLKNRMSRYSSLEYAYYNSSLISLTTDLYADETLQTESQREVLNIDAKDKKVQKYIKELFDKIGVNSQLIRSLAWNITLYGDAFCIVSANKEEGYTELVPIDVYTVKDRFEFKASEVRKKMNKAKKFNSYVKSDSRLTALSKLLDKELTNYADYFRSYLFGFDLGNDLYLPPWNILHFKSFTTQSEFWPFGRSALINSLAPFRQLQAGKNLMALTRATNFPVKYFKVKTGESVDPASQWEVVQEAKEEYHNLGNEQTGAEEFAANSSVWLPENLIDFEQIENRTDLDKIADIEMLRDDLIMGTKVPKGYLVVDKSSFGTSGQSLLRQHKPFARAVYQIQTAILEQFTQLVRLHFAMTGDYSYDTDFEISMNFPMVEEARDRIQTKNDTLRLAKDTADNLGQALGLDRGEALPPDVVKQIFGKLSFLSDEDIHEWVKATMDQKEQGVEENSEQGMLAYTKDTDRARKLVEKYTDNEFDEIVRESYYQARKGLKEGVLANKHFYTSENMSSFDKKLLDIISKNRKSGELKG